MANSQALPLSKPNDLEVVLAIVLGFRYPGNGHVSLIISSAILQILDTRLYMFGIYPRAPLHRASNSLALAEASILLFAAISA